MGKLRLLFVADFGTDIRVLSRLSQDYQLTIVTKHQQASGSTIQRMKERHLDVRLISLPDSRLRFSLHVFRIILVLRHQFDVVFVMSNGWAALTANFARLITELPVILYVGSPTVAYLTCKFRGRNPVFLSMVRLLAQGLVFLNSRLCDLNMAGGPYMTKEIKRYSKNVENVISYGVDTSLYAPVTQSQQQELRKKLGLPKDTYTIISADSVSFYKDPVCLLRAAKIIQDQGRNITILHLSGRYQRFVELASKIGISDIVVARRAVDPLGELAAYYQASDLCIQCSLEEGLGMCVLEALSCQLPTIATRVGGLQYTVINGWTGLSVPRSDSEKLAQAIEFAMDTPEKMKATAENGRRMVEEQYESEKQATRFNELIERVIKMKKS